MKDQILNHPEVESELNRIIRNEFNDFIKQESRQHQIEFLKSRMIELESTDPDEIESELNQDLSLLMNEEPDAKLDFLISRGHNFEMILEEMQ